jgi:Arc/MetJ-type ribon-helix-helix transcriptional regulator
MNFSVHLPQPLLTRLDEFAKTNKVSRSGVIRQAVESHLAQQVKSEWSPEMLAWMNSPPEPSDTDDWPDFDAIRVDANESWEFASARNLRDLNEQA